MSDDPTNPQNVELPEVQPDQAASANREANLDAILDVPVTLTLEIGRTTLPIKELCNFPSQPRDLYSRTLLQDCHSKLPYSYE